MLVLVCLHLLAAVGAPLLVRWWGRRAFWALALPSVATAGYALARTADARGGTGPVERLDWVPSLHLSITLRMDSLAWLMCLVVGIVGAMVLIYCAGYFEDDEPGLDRFAAHLTAFAGAMTGLVLSDDLLLLYLFWELTTVLSYLLVGHQSQLEDSRNAATQALVVTTAGGLAMLVGIVMVGQAAGTYSLSAILAAPPSGGTIPVAVVLLLVGAVSKSALVPFHFWLPGAMAAPTPVSAYLHAAAMVKAGVYLVARLAPGFATSPSWHPVVLTLGCLTMLIGGYRALRQVDLKLLLAYGTVSQLGFLIVLVGTGSAEAAYAGLAMLVAHAVFKAGLFLSVGAIDHATGTRDIRRLSGLRHRMPAVWLASTACAVSMAGLPPTLGFVGKEAVYETFWHGTQPWSRPVLAVLVTGSILTLAYSARFVLGAWSDVPGQRPTDYHALPAPVVAIPAVLGALSVIASPFLGQAQHLLEGYAAAWPEGDHPIHLGLWHGLTPALWLTVLTVLAGLALVAVRTSVERVQRALPHPPAAVSAYRVVMRALDRGSIEVTGGLQRGSLPLTLGLILVVFAGLTVSGLLGVQQRPALRWWDTPAQAGVALVITVAAVAAVRSRRRLRGVFLVGATGYGVAVLFLLHGAPDLALTQVLVETVSIVVFVLVLRRLSGKFNDDPSRGNRSLRIALGVVSGVLVCGAALAAAGARTAPAGSVGWPVEATTFGGGENTVNVALVDIRAWDTMGEISVVVVAATGVASLIYISQARVTATRRRLSEARRSLHQAGRPHPDEPPRPPGWLATPVKDRPGEPSLIFAVVTRLLFPVIMVWSVFLLFAGHNNPGGGFAAGLVAGLALTVRYLAGGRVELRLALPLMPGALLGTGLFLSAGFGFVSMLVGGSVLQSWDADLDLPLIGHLHLVSSVFFDLGVYLVVIGLMLDILRALGSALDRQIAEASDPDDHTVATHEEASP
ncbi:Na+/H+ antiporter subunit A [Arsenicicoccus sp. oral taxon 190]|uniref:Na+/H+ antiporter subunit A n=1 Tax=Arsenicicoccus sp. oral taxon 190 TaxID=1658671 RepID=UPI00067A16D1|nr:Na+/H+ antiporter subunit A [Arsenicicoccus sp. oral taxon 190]AKT51749.1 monovalent cation/H+ antiporter subunit A [Arsenicicoccus sp. oral taxon 190]